jgi:uncharacterized oligopeptide transporter (OPT) family protein
VIDFLALHLHAWRDTFSTAVIPGLHRLTEGIKAVFLLNTSAAVLGLGYIIGVRYAAIICAGSFLSYWVLIPLFGVLGAADTVGVFPGRPPIAGLGWEGIFFEHVRYVGIGGIFTAGVLSVCRCRPSSCRRSAKSRRRWGASPARAADDTRPNGRDLTCDRCRRTVVLCPDLSLLPLRRWRPPAPPCRPRRAG